jgi:hypothetical protein
MNFKKVFVGLMLGAVALVPMATVSAQETLVAGETVTGTLDGSNETLALNYAGTEGEIVIITYDYTDEDLYVDPLISITGPSGTVLATFEDFNYSPVIYQLPVGGDYEITFKQPDADTEGEVNITLTNPTALELDAPVTAERKSTDQTYYVYSGDADFNVVYAQDGSLPFSVTVNTFSEFTSGSVFEGATISGELVTQGSVGTIPGGTTYIIIVKEGFYFSFDEETVVNYNLAVVTPAE